MSVFPQFHRCIEEVHQQLAAEKADPMSYSTTSVVWDLVEEKAVYVFYEFNDIPESTAEDMKIYAEILAEKKKLEEKAEEQKRIVEANTLAAQEADSDRKEKEAAYKKYVSDCMVINVHPLPFFQYALDHDEHKTNQYKN